MVALTVALVVVPIAPASGQVAGYDHGWQVEGAVSGERGSTAKTVLRSELVLGADGGRYDGTLRYEDIIGVESGGAFSQSAVIELVLTGDSQAGGSQVLGSFTGTATLEVRDAASAEEGADRELLLEPASESVVYRVGGRWAGLVEESVISGDVLYETAEVVQTSDRYAVTRDAAWFNRLSAEFPDQLGAPQEYVVNLGEGTSQGGSGFWDTVQRGLRGQTPKPAPPVSDDLARSGGALAGAKPAGAVALPIDSVAIDVDVAGTYLDAKNRAAGLLGEAGPTGAYAMTLAGTWLAAYEAVPGRAAPEDVAGDALARIEAAVGASDAAAGEELLAWARDAAAGGFGAGLRTRAAVAESVVATAPYASVLGGTASAADDVLTAEVAVSGPAAEAVLAAVASPDAPESAVSVTAFEQVADAEAVGGTGEALPDEVVARHGREGADGSPSLVAPDGDVLAPEVWLPYRRADGAVYWLAGEDAAWALTDGSLRGWGYVTERAYLVEAAAVGRIAAVYPVP